MGLPDSLGMPNSERGILAILAALTDTPFTKVPPCTSGVGRVPFSGLLGSVELVLLPPGLVELLGAVTLQGGRPGVVSSSGPMKAIRQGN